MLKYTLFLVICILMEVHSARVKRAAMTYKDGEIIITSDKDKDIELLPGKGGQVKLHSPVFKIGAASLTCDTSNEGTLRYNEGDHVLEVCNGQRFVNLNAKLGSQKNPAKSCAHILADDWSAPNGAYYLETGSSVTKVYCHMDSLPGCGGGGWTTVMKTNGHKKTFLYRSAYWTNKVAYQAIAGQAGLDHQETKLPTYWTTPFSRLCIGLSLGGAPRWIKIEYRASSLFALIADGRYRAVSVGRNNWKAMIPGSSLQPNCNREGFNVFSSKYALGGPAMVRIGILGNNENECLSPDSRIGIGTGGSWCHINPHSSTGNAAGCGGDAGNKNIDAFGYILVQ